MSARFALALILVCTAGAASAQPYPSKPLRWIVPFPPGGATDVVVRLLAPRLGERLGQPVIIENRAGAGGNVGTEFVAKAPADGYNLLYVIPALVTNPSTMKSAIDPGAFTGVIHATRLGSVLLAANGFAPASVADLVALVRAKPGTVTCGAPGSLPLVGCELVKSFAGADLTIVPYKGSAQALTAVMGGEVNFVFDIVNTAIGPVKAGKVRALAVTYPRRGLAPFPELPAVAETIPNFDLTAWQGVVVAAATPRDIVIRLNREIGAVLDEPAIRQRLAETGVEAVGGTAEAFDALIRSDHKRFQAVLQAAGVKPE